MVFHGGIPGTENQRQTPQVLVSRKYRRKDRGDSFGTALTKMRRQRTSTQKNKRTRLRENKRSKKDEPGKVGWSQII